MAPLTSHVSDDIFLHIPSPSSHSHPPTILFLITGNPGLISYYTTFLTSLSTTAPGNGCVIAGFSLGGFEVETAASAFATDEITLLQALQYPYGQKDEGKGVYGLLDQIELCYARVDALVRRLSGQMKGNEGETKGGRESGRTNVILMGHSVGAYIALEVIRLWNEGARKSRDQPSLWTPTAAFLLMPTIIDLYKSTSGQLAAPVLSTLPFLPEMMQLATSALRYGLPESWLEALVSKITSMQPGQGLETTVKFLLSPKGVQQSLHLARDELAMIRADKWSDEIWGTRCRHGGGSESLHHTRDSPCLYFLFAYQDHWVADATRKQIVEDRGEDRGKVVVDQKEGLVHAWPLRQSRLVAKQVTVWLEEILRKEAASASGDRRTELKG